MELNQNKSNTIDNTGSFDLKKTLSVYTKQWKWFFISLILFLGIAYFYLRYTQPIYEASANVMITIDGGDNASSKVFKDLALKNGNEDASIEDEILVLKSRSLLETVVEKLNLNIQYFTEGLLIESEIYGHPPIKLNFMASDSIINRTNANFHIDILSENTYEFKVNDEDTPKKYNFGEKIETAFGGMIVIPSWKTFNESSIRDVRVHITPVNTIVESLRNKINIYPSQSSSKVLLIYLQDPVVEKAKDIINTLIYEYDKYSVDLKNQKSINTANFIDSRVELIAEDLVNVDDSIVRFKTGNKVTDVASEAGQFMSLSFANEQQIESVGTQLRLLNYTKDLLTNSSSFQMIPSNLGDPSISSLSNRYNELLAQRENLLKSAGEKNSVVLELDQTLKNIRNNLSQNIDATVRTLNIQLNSLENQYQRVNSKIYSVPGQESRLRSIERKQGIKESIYLYLLQKREEAIISQTVTSSNVKIIDAAYSLGKISPQGKMIYIGALFIGLFLPFSIIYVRDLLDTKIHNKEDLEQIIKDVTVLGEIPRLKGKELNSLVSRNDRSLLSESFRIIRTNFDFVRRGRHVQDYDNVIFVTSTINGEGKSFFSINMALTLANTDKRVLLIGADIRNPQTNLGLVNQKKKQDSKTGLTEYLSDDTVSVKDAISTFTVGDNTLDVLLAGKMPPNPAELLMSERMKPLFDTVSKAYDYVIVDTAPSMLVTDTLLFSQYAGHTIYMTRAGYTEKFLLSFAKDLHNQNKLKGMMLVVNDVDQSNFGYGAKYGYYGAPKKKSFFKRFSKS